MPRARKPPGAGYPNRSDLQATATAQPVQVPTGGAYGAATQLAQAQKAAPVPQAGPATSPNLSLVGGTAGPPPPGLLPQAVPAFNAATAAGPSPDLGLGRSTDRPAEPVTAGLATGPGPGPQAPPDPLIHAAASLNILQPDQIDPDTARLRAAINAHLMNRSAP